MINKHKVMQIAKRLNNAVNEELEKKGSNIRFAISTDQILRSDKTYLKILRVDRKCAVSLWLYYYTNFTSVLNDEISTIRFLTVQYESLLNEEE